MEKDHWDDYLIEGTNVLKNNLNITDSEKKKILTYASFIGTLLVLISGIIFLSMVVLDENIAVEIAFN